MKELEAEPNLCFGVKIKLFVRRNRGHLFPCHEGLNPGFEILAGSMPRAALAIQLLSAERSYKVVVNDGAVTVNAEGQLFQGLIELAEGPFKFPVLLPVVRSSFSQSNWKTLAARYFSAIAWRAFVANGSFFCLPRR